MNTTINRVVVGVDGSRNSLTALRRAAEEALRHHAELRPVLAYSSPQGEYLDMVWPPAPSEADDYRTAAYADLTRSCAQVLADLPAEVRCNPLAAPGAPGPLLVAAADRADDLLVLGGGTPSLMHRLVHGSVSRYCLSHSERTVLVVPAAEKTPASSDATTHSGQRQEDPLPKPRTGSLFRLLEDVSAVAIRSPHRV
ncbi:universal stress protein [Streptomyces sp. cg36]|uniref:universal stress protein n=1 Tax=Streptomyces sp. cg36 TaxID=3238798 RepID=UPI0034E1CDAD